MKNKMSETINLANVILILGSLYFGYLHGFEWWLIVLIALALISWGYHGFSKERKQLFEAQIRLYEAKAKYYEKKER